MFAARMGVEAAVVAMVMEAEGTVEAKAAEAMEAEVMDVVEKAVVVREEVGMAVVAGVTGRPPPPHLDPPSPRLDPRSPRGAATSCSSRPSRWARWIL